MRSPTGIVKCRAKLTLPLWSKCRGTFAPNYLGKLRTCERGRAALTSQRMWTKSAPQVLVGPASMSSFRKAWLVMRAVVRLLAVWCFAAWWAVLSLGGQGAHLLIEGECCSSTHATGHDASRSPKRIRSHVVVSFCKHGHKHARVATNGPCSPHSPADAPRQSHDSEHCSACQFFAMPQEALWFFELPGTVEILLSPRVPATPAVANEPVEPWHSRAPPVA